MLNEILTPLLFKLVLWFGLITLVAVAAKVLFTIFLKPKLDQIEDKLRDSLKPKQGQPDRLPYQRAEILTAGELAFFKVLYPVVSPHWHIFTKVRMEDIIQVRKGLEKKEAYGFRSRIKSRHIDFVLCDKESLEVLMCIELDDRSHQTAKAKESDAFKNKALEAAGVALVRIPARSNYSEDYIKPFIIDEAPISDMPTHAPVQATTPPKQETVAAVPANDDLDARWKPPA